MPMTKTTETSLLAKSLCESSTVPSPSTTLLGHLKDVYRAADCVITATGEQQLKACDLEPQVWLARLRSVGLLAAALHDMGKANNHFQRMIANPGKRQMQGLRHEWVMYWLAQQSPWKQWGPQVLGSDDDWQIGRAYV